MNSLAEWILKKVSPKLYLRYRAYGLLVKNEYSYLNLTGWMRSLEESKPVDKDGNIIPWMNYPVIEFLKKRLKNDFHLFEFGCGHSTSFYASQVQTVTSVEHDESWLKIVKKTLPSNVELIFKEKDVNGGYCRVVNSAEQKYDVIIVDGKDRVNCIKQSIKALSERGVILLDDSQRDKYLGGINYAKKNGFRTLSFEGLKSTGWGIDRTTIFYRNENCLGI